MHINCKNYNLFTNMNPSIRLSDKSHFSGRYEHNDIHNIN